jgi:hypothetical protein
LEQKRLALRGDCDQPQTNVRVWCLAAVRSLLEATGDSLHGARRGPGLFSTSEFVASAFIHAHVKDYADPPTPKVFREYHAQADLLREILGHPFRPVGFDSSWRTPTVLALARTTYEERAFEHLPILADALEEAGCSNKELLAHCRGPGPHVLGCWVLDLVLGQE